MMLSSFQPAIVTLTQILQIQPGNPTAILNRAIAEMKLKQFQAAKDDYKALRKYLPEQPYAVDYGLADIASQEKDKPEEIRRLRRYLDAAPENSTEYAMAKKRLRQLESQ
jgi:predicted Zn-dependent protease